jgi:hypothetical protein
MSLKTVKIALSISALLLTSACTHTSQRYGLSAENVAALQQLKQSTGASLQVAPFTTFSPGLNSILCRAAGPVETPDQRPFEAYLREALVSELKISGLFNEKSETILNGHLEHIDFSSNIGAGNWTIRMRFNKANETPFTIENTYGFSTNFIADIACSQVAQALNAATQDFLKKTFEHPSFKALFPKKP